MSTPTKKTGTKNMAALETVSPDSVGLDTARLERVGRAVKKYIDRKQMAGVVVLVARHGKIAYLERFGAQEIETKRPMATDTIFRIYSMTKPITSVAAMMLAEEGVIRLGDPVSKYIPAFSEPKVLEPRNAVDFSLVPAEREPTLHDLFTHTAGFSYGFDDNSAIDELYRRELWGPERAGARRSLEEVVNVLAKLPLAYHPGTAYRYSVAIDVLGYVVQAASGMPFEDFLAERIFRPLGMSDTAFWVPKGKVDRLSAVYGPNETGGINPIEPSATSRYRGKPSWASGGGGLVSTIGDYFRFGQMVLNGGELDGVRLLGRKTVEWMLQNHLPAGLRQDREGRGANGFGLGGSVLLDPGLSATPGSVGKFGWGGAANTEWWIDPVERLNCVFMTQYQPAFTIPITADFTQTVYQALM